jgi:hypothetical protein
MYTNSGTFSFLWPTIYDFDSAVAAARIGSTGAGIVALITAGLSSYQLLQLGTASSDLIYGYVGAALYALLGIGIWRLWRWAAVCALLMYWADRLLMIIATRPSAIGLAILALFTLIFISGVRGTFAAAKERSEDSGAAPHDA